MHTEAWLSHAPRWAEHVKSQTAAEPPQWDEELMTRMTSASLDRCCAESGSTFSLGFPFIWILPINWCVAVFPSHVAAEQERVTWPGCEIINFSLSSWSTGLGLAAGWTKAPSHQQCVSQAFPLLFFWAVSSPSEVSQWCSPPQWGGSFTRARGPSTFSWFWLTDSHYTSNITWSEFQLELGLRSQSLTCSYTTSCCLTQTPQARCTRCCTAAIPQLHSHLQPLSTLPVVFNLLFGACCCSFLLSVRLILDSLIKSGPDPKWCEEHFYGQLDAFISVYLRTHFDSSTIQRKWFSIFKGVFSSLSHYERSNLFSM